jgi:hypothetical protein
MQMALAARIHEFYRRPMPVPHAPFPEAESRLPSNHTLLLFAIPLCLSFPLFVIPEGNLRFARIAKNYIWSEPPPNKPSPHLTDTTVSTTALT